MIASKPAKHRGVGCALMLALGLALAPVFVSSPASAAPTDEQLSRAREMYRQGMELEAAGDWAGALAKFKAVASIKMTPQVRFHVARCQHKLGKLLEARGGYRYAAHEAASDPKAADVKKEAEAGLKEIEARIPKLIIRRAEGSQASSISMDGVALGEASIDKEIPVNPGVHTIEFTLAGRDEKQVVTVKEGETQTVELSATAGSTPTDSPADPSIDPSKPVDSGAEQQGLGVWPWVAIGVGGASLLASGTFFILRSGAKSDHEDVCVNNVCPATLKDTGDKGKTYTTLANVTLGVGLVGIAAGTIMLLVDGDKGVETSARRGPTPPSPSVTVMFGATGRAADASLVGTF